MKIEINVGLLEETNLSPNEYLYLYIIYKRGFSYLKTLDFLKDSERIIIEKNLEEREWITLGNSIINHKVSDRFLNLFLGDFNYMFEELADMYPHKVETSRSVRILKAKDASASSNNKARNKYKRIINGNPYLHRHIISCLQTQLTVEKDNLAYMQNFETWINNHTWEKYESINIKNVSNNDRRITRKL